MYSASITTVNMAQVTTYSSDQGVTVFYNALTTNTITAGSDTSADIADLLSSSFTSINSWCTYTAVPNRFTISSVT